MSRQLNFINLFNIKFKLRSVVSGPRDLLFFVTTIIQKEDFYIEMNADDKVSSILYYKISRQRIRQKEHKANEIEKKIFMYVNSSFWMAR